MIWLGAFCGFLLVLALFVAYCVVDTLLMSRTSRRHANWARTHLPQALDDTYALADDISVPLIEVVLEAERRADPEWRPSVRLHDGVCTWPLCRQCADPTARERGRPGLGADIRLFRECDCLPWPGRTSYAETNGPMRCGTCHGFIPHDRYVLPKAMRDCKHPETVDVTTLDSPVRQSLCTHCGKRIKELA
jgi:hypothetical protein